MSSFNFTLFCILHLWIITIVLLSIPTNRKANGFLALFLFLFSTLHFQHLALQTGLLFRFPYIDPVCGITLCLSFPSFLFYVKSMTGTFDWKDKKNSLHLLILIPAVLNLLYLIIFKNGEDLKEYYYEKDFRFTLVNALLLGGMTILLLFYIVLSLWELKWYSRRLKDNFSSVEKVRLDWLKQLIILLILLALFVAPLLIIIGIPEWNRIGMGIYTSIIYFSMMFKTFNQTPVSDLEIDIVVKKDSFLQISKEKEEFCFKKLETLLNENKIFLNPNLTVKQLANSIGIQPYLLSSLINQRFGMTFFDLINSYRVRETMQLLNDPVYKNWTIEAIGIKSGFGSKTAFNRVFKDSTGQTPSQCRNRNLGTNTELDFVNR